MSLNKFQFIGNLTRDAESLNTGDETKKRVVAIDIAVAGFEGSGDEKREVPLYFRIKCFGQVAENALKYLGKGSKVYLEGVHKPFKHENEGQPVYGMDLIANTVTYLNTKEPS